MCVGITHVTASSQSSDPKSISSTVKVVLSIPNKTYVHIAEELY